MEVDVSRAGVYHYAALASAESEKRLVRAGLVLKTHHNPFQIYGSRPIFLLKLEFWLQALVLMFTIFIIAFDLVN